MHVVPRVDGADGGVPRLSPMVVSVEGSSSEMEVDDVVGAGELESLHSDGSGGSGVSSLTASSASGGVDVELRRPSKKRKTRSGHSSDEDGKPAVRTPGLGGGRRGGKVGK